MVTAAEDHPGPSGSPVEIAETDLRLADRLPQLDRIAALSLLGLSGQLSSPIVGLMDPSVRRDPALAFALGTTAYQGLLDDRRPRKKPWVRWREQRALEAGKDTPDETSTDTS